MTAIPADEVCPACKSAGGDMVAGEWRECSSCKGKGVQKRPDVAAEHAHTICAMLGGDEPMHESDPRRARVEAALRAVCDEERERCAVIADVAAGDAMTSSGDTPANARRAVAFCKRIASDIRRG